METAKGQFYKNIIMDMDENQAVNFAIARVREAIEDTQRTRIQLENAIDVMADRLSSRK